MLDASLQHPNLLVPGFAKCGTTAFCNYLQQHPSVVFPAGKEPNTLYDWRKVPKWLYGNERNLKGYPIELYYERFKKFRNVPFRGDASQTYGLDAGFGHQLAKAGPNSRVFLLIRDQNERLVSTFLYFYLIHRRRSFIDWIHDFLLPDLTSFLYLDKIIAFHEAFGKDVLVIRSEALKRNPFQTMDQVFQFLGLKSVTIQPSFENANIFTPDDSRLYKATILLCRILFKGVKNIMEPLRLHDELSSISHAFLTLASSTRKQAKVRAANAGGSLTECIPPDVKSILTQDYERSIEYCLSRDILFPRAIPDQGL
jgi:hypothetical protein